MDQLLVSSYPVCIISINILLTGNDVLASGQGDIYGKLNRDCDIMLYSQWNNFKPKTQFLLILMFPILLTVHKICGMAK